MHLTSIGINDVEKQSNNKKNIWDHINHFSIWEYENAISECWRIRKQHENSIITTEVIKLATETCTNYVPTINLKWQNTTILGYADKCLIKSFSEDWWLRMPTDWIPKVCGERMEEFRPASHIRCTNIICGYRLTHKTCGHRNHWRPLKVHENMKYMKNWTVPFFIENLLKQ